MKISEVPIGHKFNHHRYGEGMIINKTDRTISAVFENGNKCKVTYRQKDCDFSPFDF